MDPLTAVDHEYFNQIKMQDGMSLEKRKSTLH